MGLMDHAASLVLARVSFPLRLLVLVLTVVKHSADRGRAVRVDLHQVEAALSGDAQGFLEGNDPVVLVVRPNETDLFGPDPVVDPKLSDYTCPLSNGIRATITGQYSTLGYILQRYSRTRGDVPGSTRCPSFT